MFKFLSFASREISVNVCGFNLRKHAINPTKKNANQCYTDNPDSVFHGFTKYLTQDFSEIPAGLLVVVDPIY